MENFKDKTVYQIYPRSFCDSNGDGFGDLRGITGKLDYLKDLGVDYLWITPFFRSPQRDNGYDVADYRAIEPVFGTMEDVEELIAEADSRGIGLMFDMVFNHTSTEHEWFQRALAGEEKYQNYYIFKDGTPDQIPTNWESKFGGPAWEYVPSLGKWYLHLFDVTQADLNWENPEVREELKEIIRFWKQKGVKGFRFDVVNLISKPEVFENDYEGDGRRFYTDGRHVHEFLHELVHDTGIAGMVTVGEMSSTSLENCIRYSNPECEELSMAFSFHHLKIDYKDGNKWELMKPDLGKLKELFETWQTGMQQGGGWNAVFWDNHDQPRIVSRLGDDQKYWKESAKMLGAAIHLMRGTPYVYQGDELGMTNAYFTDIAQYRDVESRNYYRILLENGKSEKEALQILGERSRDNGRTPMRWNAEKYAGFLPENASAEPWIEVTSYRKEANAEAQIKDSDSIYSFYRTLIRMRKEYPLISEGNIRFLYQETDGVLAYERYFEKEGEKKLIVLCNLLGEEVRLTLPEAGGKVLLGNYPGAEDAAAADRELTLRPYEVLAIEK
ncbi:MAG: alpha,alpha-phosphotrehalase [Eubacteriales bacterium]|nr:alpha,alpha-phosphotrehalase [Eubacteriales bacterium]